MQVGNQLVDLQMQPLTMPAPQARWLIELHLSPVGAHLHIQTSEQLRSLAIALLTTAVGMHQAGIVHCDIRPANIVQYRGEWVLIDWELAGRIDREVWWRAKERPPFVQLNGTWPIAADLWQIGRVIQGFYHHPPDQHCQNVARALLEGALPSAEDALAMLLAG